MIDFEELSRKLYEGAAPDERARIDRARREREEDLARPRARVAATRTSCLTGDKHEVEIVLVVRPGSDGKPWLFVDEGGPTGYESIPFEVLDRAIDENKPWAACMGTQGRWDGLEVGVESLRAARAALGPR